jgi:hypothetical protein
MSELFLKQIVNNFFEFIETVDYINQNKELLSSAFTTVDFAAIIDELLQIQFFLDNAIIELNQGSLGLKEMVYIINMLAKTRIETDKMINHIKTN